MRKPVLYRRLLFCVMLASSAQAAPTSSPASTATSTITSSQDKLRQFMLQVRPQPTASQAGGNAVRAAAKVTPEQLQERADQIKTGETALSNMQLEPALMAFERAANILHAADTEIALVRTYMQFGQYRRALASGAHTAGAHLDVVGGSALYAWLLHVGAQTAIAQRLLAEAQTRMPGDVVLAQVQQQLASSQPLATGDMLDPPTRLAPYGFAQGIAAGARVVGSATLLDIDNAQRDKTDNPRSQHAVMPLALMPASGKLWLRNGLGMLTQARVTKRLPKQGIAFLALSTALPLPSDFWAADKEPFPGSPGYVVEYVASKATPDAGPAWPILRTGFIGGMAGSAGNQRLLGVDMPPGLRGGPVFDSAGRLVGVAIPGSGSQSGDQLVTTVALQKAIGKALAPAIPAGALSATTADKIYESSLKSSLQVIAIPQ